MQRFQDSTDAFSHAILRAKDMIKLFDALTLISGNASKDDALRAAYFQAVSSFDFYVHEVVAIEAIHRFKNSLATRNIAIPMEMANISSLDERYAAVDNSIRDANSYKAFVDPEKLAKVLSCFCEKPWDKISIQYNIDNSESATREDLTSQLKSIWKRRNKIAHEADINPALSGVTLWPIDKQDAEITISFVSKIGLCIPKVISLPL
jgi:hypothetical protein